MTSATRTINRSTILDFIRAAGLDPERVTHLSINPFEFTVDYVHETVDVLNIEGEPTPAYETRQLRINIVEDDE